MVRESKLQKSRKMLYLLSEAGEEGLRISRIGRETGYQYREIKDRLDSLQRGEFVHRDEKKKYYLTEKGTNVVNYNEEMKAFPNVKMGLEERRIINEGYEPQIKTDLVKRGENEIMVEVLNAIRIKSDEGIKKTNIGFEAGLNPGTNTKYLEEAERQGFVRKEENGNTITYFIKDSGRSFLLSNGSRRYLELISQLKPKY